MVPSVAALNMAVDIFRLVFRRGGIRPLEKPCRNRNKIKGLSLFRTVAASRGFLIIRTLEGF